MEARNIAVGDFIDGVKVARMLEPSGGRLWFGLADGSIVHFAPGDRVAVTVKPAASSGSIDGVK